jgi:cytochrome c oxidase accessory protein FixG
MIDPPAQPGCTPTLLSPWRRSGQWLASLLLLLIPWFHLGGHSLLRIDIPQLRLYLFGQTLHIEELYLVLLFTLIVGFAFLLVTVVLGRVWCGWLCPQTTLCDLAEWAARRLGLKVEHNRLVGDLWRKILIHGVYLLLSFLVSANLLWYFIEPHQFFSQLAGGELHYAAVLTLVLTGLLVYLDLALVRRLMCSDFCPYGRIQTALVDKATLTLHLPPQELPRCIKCGACVRTCPMEIDIRQGYQVQCINCGRCLDACRKTMAKRAEPGLISYTFGLADLGAKSLLNLRVLLPSLLLLGLLIVLSVAMIDRVPVSLKVSVSHTAAARELPDHQLGTFFNAWVNNRSPQTASYTLVARRRADGADLPLKGQHQATLAPGENRRLDFIVITPSGESLAIELLLLAADGSTLAVADASIDGTALKARP